MGSSFHASKEIYLHNLRRQEKTVTESAEVGERVQNRIAELDAQIFKSIQDRREASIAAGRAFKELKKILGHGKWLHHFNEMFTPTGLKLRTAQRWMNRARREDTDSKNGRVTHFKTASDASSREVKDAAEQDKAEVNAASEPKMPRTGHRLYCLPLHMSDELQEAMDALRKFAAWPEEEKKIVQGLHQLCLDYGVINNTRRRS
jgi:hypothetical protein